MLYGELEGYGVCRVIYFHDRLACMCIGIGTGTWNELKTVIYLSYIYILVVVWTMKKKDK